MSVTCDPLESPLPGEITPCGEIFREGGIVTGDPAACPYVLAPANRPWFPWHHATLAFPLSSTYLFPSPL